MEPKSALVWTDGAVHLNAKAAIDLNLALIIEPGNAEHHDALGFYHALEDASFPILGMPLQHEPQ